ncbi:MAG TPA: ferredoxin, partial [Marmoricola sp.]|nr:ferredoxin [Marmoricola sp.]
GGWVHADHDLCQGHQMCQAEAPEVFGFDEQSDKVVVLDVDPSPERRAGVERAVKYCPAMALTMEDR